MEQIKNNEKEDIATLNFSKVLKDKVKIRSAELRISIKQFVEDAIQEKLKKVGGK